LCRHCDGDERKYVDLGKIDHYFVPGLGAALPNATRHDRENVRNCINALDNHKNEDPDVDDFEIC